jgi:hypothetical protein
MRKKNYDMLKQTLLNLMKRNYPVILLLMAGYNGIAQTSISGPDCIIPGTTYQYMINGNWDSNSSMRVCVTGGKLSTGSNCSPQNAVTYMVFVIWNDSVNRKIEVASSSGNASLVVSGTTELSGGQVVGNDQVQTYNKNQAEYIFHCKDSRGGSCTPTYDYQWQRSDNGLNWINIEGAKGKDLFFSGNILCNTFFRRVTNETRSNSIAYSDQAILAVNF